MQISKRQTVHRSRLIPLACLLVVSAAGIGAQAQPAPQPPPVAPAFKLVLEPRALDLLKATSARLAAARAMSFTATVGYEHPSKLGPAILYTVRYDVTTQRPDKFRVMTVGDGPASEFYYDGKSMMAFAPAENLVAVATAPSTTDAALEAVFRTADIYYPFTDLLLADPYAALADRLILAFTIGPSAVVGDTRTEMVAVANNDVFLQIWIGADNKLPRRIRAIYKVDPLRLRHDMVLSNWQLDAVIAPDAFALTRARSARPIAFASPVRAQPAGTSRPDAPRLPPAGATPPQSKPQ